MWSVGRSVGSLTSPFPTAAQQKRQPSVWVLVVVVGVVLFVLAVGCVCYAKQEADDKQQLEEGLTAGLPGVN